MLFGSMPALLWQCISIWGCGRQVVFTEFINTDINACIDTDFFMITGTNLLSYREKYNTRTFLKRRFKRTVIPFVFWTFFYLIRPVWMDGEKMPGLNEFRDALLDNQATNIFWFFYVLFAIYICMPVFSLLAKPENFRIAEYICLLSILTTAVYSVVTRFCFPITNQIIPPFVTGYIGYVFLGWVIYHENYSKKIRTTIYVLGIMGAFLMFFGTWFLSAKAGSTDTLLMEYNSLACYPMSAAVMLFSKHVKWEKYYRFISQRMVAKIASAGLGIYVLHLFFIMVAQKWGILTNHTMYYTVIMPFVIYGISLTTVLIVQKVPILRRLLP